jgi:DNA-binding response OmpR family regulator
MNNKFGCTERRILEKRMKKILLINNDESMRILYSDELLEEGYVVTETFMGSHVIGLIEEIQPDLVLLGMGAGEAEGFDLLLDIRDACDDLPVLVCADTLPLHGRMRSVAADFFVVKCSRLIDLKHRIEMILESGIPSQSSPAREIDCERGSACMCQIDFYCQNADYEQEK